MAQHDVVICIPTYRRPNNLRRCLQSLAALATDRSVRVIVADNDPDRKEGIEVCRSLERDGFRFPITPVSVGERGVSASRNALVAEAIRDPATDHIAMIDDDEWAEPDWLSELLRTQAAYGADVVGGPVLRVFQDPVPAYVAQANQPRYDRMRSGQIPLLDATSNILFEAALFRSVPAPWFDPRFALMGGEDRDILLGFKLAGKLFAWAHEARVTEEMPSSRCSAKWMIQRAYRVGNTDMLVHLKHRPPGFNVLTESAKILGAAAVAASKVVVFAWHPAHRFEGARLGARVAGKLVALAGGRHQEYKVIHGG